MLFVIALGNISFVHFIIVSLTSTVRLQELFDKFVLARLYFLKFKIFKKKIFKGGLPVLIIFPITPSFTMTASSMLVYLCEPTTQIIQQDRHRPSQVSVILFIPGPVYQFFIVATEIKCHSTHIRLSPDTRSYPFIQSHIRFSPDMFPFKSHPVFSF